MRQYLWIAIFLIGCGSTTAPTPTEPELTAQHARLEPVQFQTPDGFLLFGTLFSSPNHPAPRPAVILLHPFNQDHFQWADFVPELVAERGYVALAFDLRGHGSSIFRNGQPYTIQNFSFDDFNQMQLDVVAAIAFLKTRAEADPNRIGVIGTDIGANIAFVSAGLFPDIKATVSVSPEFRVNQAQEFLIGTNIPDFAPRNILYLAAFGDGYAYTSSQNMSELTRGVTAVIGYQGTGHGLDLLAQGNAWTTVLDWLDQNL
ncbi:MAG: alpha/beta fold hydrolase [Gemmatimonadota bacterium]|nr:alpha/beta fold hydrolase [Gemmatimonadota bacterium]